MVFMFNNSDGHKERVKIIIKEITKRIINVVILVFRWSREIERDRFFLKFNTAAPLFVKMKSAKPAFSSFYYFFL